MTDNISKLYRLNNIDKVFYVSDDVFEDGYDLNSIKEDYPPFTAEKQLKLIKWLATKFILGNFKGIDDGLYNFNLCLTVTPLNKHIISEHIEYKQALAGLVCELWKDLIDEQREEVRGILQ